MHHKNVQISIIPGVLNLGEKVSVNKHDTLQITLIYLATKPSTLSQIHF